MRLEKAGQVRREGSNPNPAGSNFMAHMNHQRAPIHCAAKKCKRPLTWVMTDAGWVPVGKWSGQQGKGFACESCTTPQVAAAAIAKARRIAKESL